MKKKWFGYFLAILSIFALATSVFAATHSRGPKWVRNTENWHQLTYYGEAYTRLGWRRSQITYYRDGSYIGGAYALVTVGSGAVEDYSSVTVWDSLNPWAAKTTYYYSI